MQLAAGEYPKLEGARQCMALQRVRRATEDVFTALPAVVADMDLEGHIEISTDTAARHFGMRAGAWIGLLVHPAALGRAHSPLRTDTPLFGFVILGSAVFAGALLLLPVVVLGPIAEHLASAIRQTKEKRSLESAEFSSRTSSRSDGKTHVSPRASASG